MIAFLCGHNFNPDDFQNYPDDYAGYCPACIARMKDEADQVDTDDEPDGTGLMEYDGDSFAEDDDSGNDESDLDDYEDDTEDSEIDEDPLADETEEDDDRDIRQRAEEIAESLDSVYNPRELLSHAHTPIKAERVEQPSLGLEQFMGF